MDRFSKFETTRFAVEVNVPGFDVRRSIARANKQKQKRRATQPAGQPQTSPIDSDSPTVVFGDGGGDSDPGQENPCQQFRFDL